MSLDLPAVGGDVDDWGDKLNAALTDLDSRISAFPGGAWSDYTPTVGGTGWALGDGTCVGRYIQLGKTVHVAVNVTWGAASTYGSSQLTLSLPTARSGFPGPMLMAARFRDVSDASSLYMGQAGIGLGLSVISIRSLTASGLGKLTDLIATTPFTWAVGDQVQVSGTYEAA